MIDHYSLILGIYIGMGIILIGYEAVIYTIYVINERRRNK